MGQSRKRERFLFWLYPDTDSEIINIIDYLKGLKNYSFVQAIRDGLRLIGDLRDGKLDVLFELFPWVKAEFLEYMREVKGTSAAKSETESTSVVLQNERRLAEAQKALEAERRAIEQERQRMEAERAESQSAIQQQLTRLEALLLQQGNQPIDSPTQSNKGEQAASSSPKQLAVPKFTAPTYDDDDEDDLLEVKEDKSAGMRATQNFLKSLMSLNEEPSKPPKIGNTGDTKSRRKRSQEMQQ